MQPTIPGTFSHFVRFRDLLFNPNDIAYVGVFNGRLRMRFRDGEIIGFKDTRIEDFLEEVNKQSNVRL